MKTNVPMILWHEKQPILSIDFSPTDPQVFATAGGDKHINIWSLCSDEKKHLPAAKHLCSLQCHNTVNVLRFSPAGDMMATGGVTGEIALWRPVDQSVQRAPVLGQDSEEGPALWKHFSSLKGHAEDVQDVAWSPDGSALVSGGVEGVVVLWDLEARRPLARLDSHQHYVQGVCWDPLGWGVLTTSNDRTAKVFSCRPGGGKKHAASTSLYPAASCAALLKEFHLTVTLSRRTLPATQPDNNNAAGITSGASAAAPAAPPAAAAAATAGPMPAPPSRHPLFLDESSGSIFRRPAWSPDGSLVVLPAGLFKADSSSAAAPVTYLFSRSDWSSPLAQLPSIGSQATVAAAFSPVLYRPWGTPAAAAAAQAAGEAAASPGSAAAAVEATTPHACMAGLPYRMLWAVATHNSVAVYDTQTFHQQPLALLGGAHLHAITDIAWSSDGRCLATASLDGYVCLTTWEEGELGQVVPAEELPRQVAACTARTQAKRWAERVAAAQGLAGSNTAGPQVAPAPVKVGKPSGKAAPSKPATGTAAARCAGGGSSSAGEVQLIVIDGNSSDDTPAAAGAAAAGNAGAAEAPQQQVVAAAAGGKRRICPQPLQQQQQPYVPAAATAVAGPSADVPSSGCAASRPAATATPAAAATAAGQPAAAAAAAAGSTVRCITPKPVAATAAAVQSDPQTTSQSTQPLTAAEPPAAAPAAAASASPNKVPAEHTVTCAAPEAVTVGENGGSTDIDSAAAPAAAAAVPAAPAAAPSTAVAGSSDAGRLSLAQLAAQAGLRAAAGKRGAPGPADGATKRQCT